ncbi:hypothetical protein HNQ91_003096 [Filimonas zeae]|nr:hypothetical protein [Filimonas zeae]
MLRQKQSEKKYIYIDDINKKRLPLYMGATSSEQANACNMLEFLQNQNQHQNDNQNTGQ